MNLITKKMKLLFWFSKSKQPGYGTIKLSIQIDGQESQVTTGIKVKKEEWRGNLKRFTDKRKNEVLAKMEQNISKLLDYMTVAGVSITAESIANTYKGLTKDNLSPTKENIIAISEPLSKNYKVIEIFDKLIELKKNELSEVTLRSYFYKRNKFFDYLKSIGRPHFIANDFESSDLQLYIDYLFEQKLSKNHVNRNCIVIKSAFKEAFKRKFIKKYTLDEVTVSKEERCDLRHLTLDELERLERLDISKNINTEYDNLEGLEIARDLFVFMCYTGFHSVDRLNLKDEDLVYKDKTESYWIISSRSKTKQKFNVKVHPNAMLIIQKYGGLSKMPKMHRDTLSHFLKRLEQMIDVRLGLSSKIGRKTFAHIALNEWMVDKDSLAKAMGLKSPKHIAAYGEIDIDRLDKVFNF